MGSIRTVLSVIGLGWLIYIAALVIAFLLASFIRDKKKGIIIGTILSISICILTFVFTDTAILGWTAITLGIILGIVMIYFDIPSYPKLNNAINRRYASKS